MDNIKLEQQNLEMADFLSQYPLENKDLNKTLEDMEENVTAIRSFLERKTKRITMKELNEKLDLILKILLQNGFVHHE